jgi:hypothetical protein
MAKVLNTRLQLRYDTYENWTAKNSPLLEGEIAVVAIPTGKSEMQVTGSQPPQILFKVGPGNFNSLPWASAKAADVHDWAKAANLIVEAAAGQTGNVVSGISWDATNKKITYTTASVATSEGLQDVQTRLANLETEVGDKANGYASSRIDQNASEIAAVKKTISDNQANWAKDDNTTYTFKEVKDSDDNIVGIEIAGSDNTKKSISFDFLTEEKLDSILHPVNEDGESDWLILDKAMVYDLQAVNNIAFTDDGENEQDLVADYENQTFKIKQGKTEKTIATVDQIPTELGVMDVDGSNAIEVTGDANKVVKLKINSNKGNVTFDNTSDGLRANVDLSAYQTIANDQDTKYGIEYDSANKLIKLTNDFSKSSISAADFIKDGMLEKVEVNNDNNTITFTWNTDGKSTVTTVELDKLADIYTATQNAAEVQVAISNTNQISASLVNKGITEAKLADSVTEKLNKTWEEAGAVASLKSDLENGTITVGSAEVAEYALKDDSGNDIIATYQTKNLSSAITVGYAQGATQYSTVESALSAINSHLNTAYASALQANSGVGAITGGSVAAKKAEQDANGNVITATYATKDEVVKLTGDQNVKGTKTFEKVVLENAGKTNSITINPTVDGNKFYAPGIKIEGLTYEDTGPKQTLDLSSNGVYLSDENENTLVSIGFTEGTDAGHFSGSVYIHDTTSDDSIEFFGSEIQRYVNGDYEMIYYPSRGGTLAVKEDLASYIPYSNTNASIEGLGDDVLVICCGAA